MGGQDGRPGGLTREDATGPPGHRTGVLRQLQAVRDRPDPALRLASVAATVGQGARLVVVVPAALSRQQVPASAFGVTRAGRGVPVTVRRVVDAGLEVYLVLDTTVDPATLAAEQSSAADLLRNLPPSVRVATTTTDEGTLPVPTAMPGNLGALRALAAVRPQATAFLPERLNAIASMPVGRHRRVIVLLTDCLKQGASDLTPVRAALATGDQQLDVVAPGAGCPSEVTLLAGNGRAGAPATRPRVSTAARRPRRGRRSRPRVTPAMAVHAYLRSRGRRHALASQP